MLTYDRPDVVPARRLEKAPGTDGGGEIRGFLAPVPEPGSYALLLSGLAVVGWVARRQKRGA